MGIFAPLTGLMAYAPVKTPVFFLDSSVRSRSLLRAASPCFCTSGGMGSSAMGRPFYCSASYQVS